MDIFMDALSSQFSFLTWTFVNFQIRNVSHSEIWLFEILTLTHLYDYNFFYQKRTCYIEMHTIEQFFFFGGSGSNLRTTKWWNDEMNDEISNDQM